MCLRELQRATAVLLGIATLLLGTSRVSLSQEPTAVAVGSRVRVKAKGEDQRWVIGELLESSLDSVRIRQENWA